MHFLCRIVNILHYFNALSESITTMPTTRDSLAYFTIDRVRRHNLCSQGTCCSAHIFFTWTWPWSWAFNQVKSSPLYRQISACFQPITNGSFIYQYQLASRLLWSAYTVVVNTVNDVHTPEWMSTCPSVIFLWIKWGQYRSQDHKLDCPQPCFISYMPFLSSSGYVMLYWSSYMLLLSYSNF